jgi:hypothetical protein
MEISSLLEKRTAKGSVLAEGKWARMLKGLDGSVAESTALVLENTAQFMANMDETVRAVNVGNFDRFAFPLIRATYPQLAAHELVSVQPMDGPVGLIFYYDLVYGSNKGAIQRGQPVFSSLTGHPGDDSYSSQEIRDENVGTGTGAVANYTPTLSWTPVLPGTVELSDGTQVVIDDGSGNLIGNVNPAGNNTINYGTGVVDVTFAVNVAAGTAVSADYEYDNEANSQVPEIDFQITHSPVAAKVNKLRTRYSLEAAQNLRSLHGLSAEAELVVALAQELRFEIDRTIIRELDGFAQATAVTWPLTPPAGISFTEHKLSFVDAMIQASNNVFELTRRGQPNWMVCGLRVANVVESLPGFKASPQLAVQNGVIYAGDLNGRWRVYKDPYNIDGTTDQRNFLVGWKGPTFMDAGFVYSPYIPFYTTPNVVLDDFISRKGMATSWGRKKINGRFYCSCSVTGTFAP